MTKRRLSQTHATTTPMYTERYPAGWDEERVRKVLAHYEDQTEEECVAEDEAASEDATHTMMSVPSEIVADVRELIARHGR